MQYFMDASLLCNPSWIYAILTTIILSRKQSFKVIYHLTRQFPFIFFPVFFPFTNSDFVYMIFSISIIEFFISNQIHSKTQRSSPVLFSFLLFFNWAFPIESKKPQYFEYLYCLSQLNTEVNNCYHLLSLLLGFILYVRCLIQCFR